MQLLSGNVFLRRLNLRDNGIGTAGCAALCEMLKANTTLVEIDLAVNNLNVGGAELVASMLKENTTVHTVNLAYNNLMAPLRRPDHTEPERKPWPDGKPRARVRPVICPRLMLELKTGRVKGVWE